MPRRMFSPKIVESDAFLDMPISTQALYFHFGMEADDDGFVNPKKIMRVLGSSDDDMKVLVGKRFVLPFENGVIVIKHWRINNFVRKDFYRETVYLDQKKRLKIKENGSYTDNVNKLVTNCVQNVDVGKDRLGKDRLGNTTDGIPSDVPFLLSEEIKKLDESKRRDMNIIALYFEQKKPNFENKEQFNVALRRHLRAAKDLSVFSDNQIIDAIPKAKAITQGWTIDTLVKVLIK